MRQTHIDPLPLQARLAEFEILDILAEGDFGILYRARDHVLDRDITLREYLPAGFAQRNADGGVSPASERDEELFAIGLRGFIDEARSLARLEHPALMKVYRFWEANGTAYMAMPFHDGLTLEAAIGNGRVGKGEQNIARLLAEPLDALALLHEQGRTHGGIAPDAILLRPDGRGLLLDTGAARKTLADLALTPTAMLKPGYAALEQYEVIPGLKPGPWTDAYALAAVAYTLVAGTPPPDAETRSERDAMLPAREVGAGRYPEPFLAALDEALALMPQQRSTADAALRAAFGAGHARPQPDAYAQTLAAPQPVRAADTRATAPADARTMFTASATMASAAAAGPITAIRPEPTIAANAMNAMHGTSATNPTSAPYAMHPTDTTVAPHAPPPPGRAPARRSRRRIPETAFVVAIAAALYAGFRSLPMNESGPARPAPTVVAEVPQAPAGNANPAAPAAATAPAAPAAGEAGSAPRSAAGPAAASPAQTNPTVAAAQQAMAAQQASAAQQAARTPQPATAPQFTPAQQAAAAMALPGIAAPVLQARPAPASRADAAQRAALQREETAWLSAQSIDTPDAYDAFLAAYPDSDHAPAARVMVARLRWEQRQAEAARSGRGGSSPAQPTVAARTPQLPEVREASPRPVPARAGQAPRIEDRIAIARPPEAATVPVAPAQQAAETATVEGRTIRLRGQTMTGEFTPDPATGAVSGRGRIAWDNGDRFDGTLVRGVKEGRGEFVWANGQRYRGDFAGGLPNGRGSIQFPNGNRYEGEMRNGAPNGTGTITFANGNRYTGEVRDGLPNGRGTNRFANGDTYAGAWRMGRSDGHGRYTWANGDVWEGEFRDGAKTANGRMVATAGDRVGAAASGSSTSGTGASDAEDPFLK